MIFPRWRKVFHDLWSNKSRSILVILTIAVGVFAVGFVCNMLFIGVPEMNADYLSVNPHSAILYTDPFANDLLPSLQHVPGVGQVEGRSQVTALITLPNGQKRTIVITGIPPLDKMRLDVLRPAQENGTIPPLDTHEMYIERTALSGLPVKPGDTLQVELYDGMKRSLRVAAIVFDVTSVPYFFSRQLYAYTNVDTINWLGGPARYNQVYLSVSEDQRNEEHVRVVASRVARQLENSDRVVYFTYIYNPGRHFASDITTSLASIMMVFGLLSVFLSAFLVINTVNALLGQQVRQIGVMKAVGAHTGQLLVMYLTLVLVFGLLALAIALPLGILMSHSAGGGISSMLNYNSGPARNSTQGLVLQLIVALVIPLAATLFPVLHGTRISVREAISSYGLGQGMLGKGLLDRLVESIRFLPRPLLISLRNTFRRKGRLALTLSTLVLAGAIFISVFHLRSALKNAIDETLGYVLTDVNVGFARSYRLEKVLPVAMNIPGVVDAEAWGEYIASVLKPGSGAPAESESGTQIQLLAPPSSSKLIKPTLSSGRWLLPGDQNALVIGNHLVALRPELKTGQTVTLNIQGKKSSWTIVGIYRMVGNTNTPIVYANNDYLQQLMNTTNQVNSLRVVTTQHDAVTQKRVAQALELLYKESGIEVTTTLLGTDIVAANVAQTDVLVYFLLLMAFLIAAVGGLGLASTMSMNVFERIREVGVIRAIGASNHDILWMVIVEGLLIGIISWVLAIALSIPIGSSLANILGKSMLQSPMKFVFSMDGVWIWLIMVLVISSLASAMPARGAARMTIREVLAYE